MSDFFPNRLIGICELCKRQRLRTQHSISLAGHHFPPFVLICRTCHDQVHGAKANLFQPEDRLSKTEVKAFIEKSREKYNSEKPTCPYCGSDEGFFPEVNLCLSCGGRRVRRNK